ncbi:MAG: NrfD/PsrC family molybdoenzyme membrane anchor subunit, partial [Slackia isoflavoniconvertens]|nr:NrfD/PsrC family molybdoenzyme membrane anchor subunit [Slackia isoflavoniconvertens]
MTENEKAATAVKDASPKQKRETWGGKGLNVAIIVAAVLTVAGIACWAMQLSGGMVQTGMRNLDSWGLYITNFMFFVGLSAGGLIISSVPNAFGMKGFGGI